MIDAQFAAGDTQGEEKQRRRNSESIQRIQCRGKETPATPTDGLQQIIHQTQPPAQQRCLQR